MHPTARSGHHHPPAPTGRPGAGGTAPGTGRAGGTGTAVGVVAEPPGALSAPPEVGRRDRWARLRAVPAGAWLAGVIGLTVGSWAMLQFRFPYLGHDEAVYASQARHWAFGVPAAGWEAYRPVGLPALGALILRATEGLLPPVLALRTLTLLAAVGLVVAVYLLTARIAGRHRALVAVAVLIGGVTFVRRLPEFLDDIASTALFVAVAHLALRARARPGHGGRDLTVAAVLAVAGCLLRYGATSAVLAVVIAAVLTWGPRTWLRSWRELGGAVAVLGVTAAAVGVVGMRTTGRPWGSLLTAAEVAHRRYPGEGLVFYATAFPLRLAGPLGAVVMAAGLVGAAVAWRRTRTAGRWVRLPVSGPRDRADLERVFLVLAAVAQIVLLGTIAHGEPRFVLFPIALLTVLGADALGRLPQPWRRRALVAVAAAVLPSFVLANVVAWRGGGAVTADRAPLVRAVQAVRPDGPCVVVTPLVPETGWATSCRVTGSVRFGAVPAAATVVVLEREGAADDPDLAEVRRELPGRTWTTRRLVTGPEGRAVLVAVSRP